MYQVSNAEEYLAIYEKTNNPFEIKTNEFETIRLAINIQRKLEEKIDNKLMLLKIYLDIATEYKHLSAYEVRFLKKLDSSKNALGTCLLYYAYELNVSPFYININKRNHYLLKAAELNFPYAIEKLISYYYLKCDDIYKDIDINTLLLKVNDENILNIIKLQKDLSSNILKTKQNAIEELHEKAIEGYPLASIILGKEFEDGINVEKNLTKARQYYDLSIKNNDYTCIKKLVELYIDRKSDVINIKKALTYLKQIPINHLNISHTLLSIKIRLETQDISIDEINKIITFLQNIEDENANILLGKIYLKYPKLKNEKTGIYILNQHAYANPDLFYDLYIYYSETNNRKEAIRNLRRGVVNGSQLCKEEAKCYQKLRNLIN